MKIFAQARLTAVYIAATTILAGCGSGISENQEAKTDSSKPFLGSPNDGLVTVETISSDTIPTASAPSGKDYELPEFIASATEPSEREIPKPTNEPPAPSQPNAIMLPEEEPQPDAALTDTISDTSSEREAQTEQTPEPQPESLPEPEPESQPEPEVQPEPEPTPPPIENLNKIVVGSNPGDAQCLDFGSVAKDFGSVTDDDWRSWMPNFRFSIGEQFLAVEVDENGESNLRHKYAPSERGSERVVMGADLAEYNTYRITEKVFLEPGWQWGGDTYEGGKLAFGFGGGAAPSGGIIDPTGFTARVMWRGNYLGGGEYDGTGRFVIYSYAADRPENTGEDIFYGDYEVPIGEWIQITYEVKANSSTSSSDGHVRAWVNGELMVDNAGMGWQLAGGVPVIDTLYYSSFYGGSNADWAPSTTTYAKVKDVCWAPVVNGYSGINPENGVLFLDPESANKVLSDDSASLELWADLQHTTAQAIEESKTWLQITAASAAVTSQVHYTSSVSQLNEALGAVRQGTYNSLGLNPTVGIAGAMRSLEAAISGSDVKQVELDDSARVIKRLESALLTSVELSIEVVENHLVSIGCDTSSTSLTCFERLSILDEVRGLQVQLLASISVNWQDASRLSEIAWNRSVDALRILEE